MNGWVILVDQARDFPNADAPHKVITTGDYLARPKLFAGLGRAKIINLSRSYNYQSKGYYASLLAEARGHRVIPTVETMLDLRELKLYEQSLPELQEALTAAATTESSSAWVRLVSPGVGVEAATPPEAAKSGATTAGTGRGGSDPGRRPGVRGCRDRRRLRRSGSHP